MKFHSMKQLFIGLFVFALTVSARGDIESLAKRHVATANSISSSPMQHSLQQAPRDQLQGQWKTSCETDESGSTKEEVIVTDDILARTFEVSVGASCLPTADVIGIQTGRFVIGREIATSVFEIDWVVDQSNTTALTPAGAAELNANGGLCGLQWEVGASQDTTACLGPFAKLYSAFSVNDSKFVWASRTASQTGLSPDTRATNLNFATSYTRQ